MRTFFKIFFASFLALVIFTLIVFFLIIGVVTSVASKSKPRIDNKSVLLIDLGTHFPERKQNTLAAKLSGGSDIPGVYDVVRLIDNAASDKQISGIMIQADNNANGFATSNEIRLAITRFQRSKKFVIAYGETMSQGAYFVASAADKIYVNPAGDFEWKGFAVGLVFLKGMLDKLEIQPQIFYAGKFKSATEPLRTTQMTPENRLQTTVWLNDIYQYFLGEIAKSRGLDTATLHGLADSARIQNPQDAVASKLITGVKYDDEVRAEMKSLLGIAKNDKLNLVPLSTYDEAVNLRKTGKDRVALIYAEGNIVDGAGGSDNIGGENYRKIIRKARLDPTVKAIVLRVNSGGGSALASEVIWRELQLAKADGKPVIVSFGDVAASGGYYISTGADSIFASPNTITGSIGVFSVIPNMGNFFKNKLGVTFDGVKTGPYADAPSLFKELNDGEKQQMQNSVDRIYAQFKQRVATGRKRDVTYIDSIAQGRVWSGKAGTEIGLVDRIGGLQDAVNSAVGMAKLSDYGVKEYPESGTWIEDLLNKKKAEPEVLIREQIGADNFKIYQEMQRVRELTGSAQTRLPFEFFIH